MLEIFVADNGHGFSLATAETSPRNGLRNMRARIAEIPDAQLVMQSEEHLVIESPMAKEFPIGQSLHALPKHICPTVALHSEAVLVEDGMATERWPILARARRLTI